MSFKKKTKVNNLESYRVEVKVMHGDGDLYEKLTLGPFSKEKFPEVVGIQTAFEEMLNNDKETNNSQEYYENLPYFSRFLMPHWKYDVFAKECDIYRYVMVKEYAFFYIDENGDEYEIEQLSLDDFPKFYYIKIKLRDGKSFTGIHTEEVVITYCELEEELQSSWGLVPLENGEEFVSKYYAEKEIDREDWIDEREFFILKHFGLKLEDEESEYAYYDELEKIENKYS
ncbi:gp409 [Bacillus phage G]|uniref:Gp409 n=1 Tax=Bacillus phage G TaxID=2884420 RepID=G3MAF0_9CAUD|nr:gp409 [Bacillus phage G]AEO93667.1 gp409 [Bacillus phage G]